MVEGVTVDGRQCDNSEVRVVFFFFVVSLMMSSQILLSMM